MVVYFVVHCFCHLFKGYAGQCSLVVLAMPKVVARLAWVGLHLLRPIGMAIEVLPECVIEFVCVKGIQDPDWQLDMRAFS